MTVMVIGAVVISFLDRSNNCCTVRFLNGSRDCSFFFNSLRISSLPEYLPASYDPSRRVFAPSKTAQEDARANNIINLIIDDNLGLFDIFEEIVQILIVI